MPRLCWRISFESLDAWPQELSGADVDAGSCGLGCLIPGGFASLTT